MALPGAVATPTGEVAWHYGDPLGEQRPSAVFVDRSFRTVTRLRGPDAGTLLNNLLSQKLDDMPVGAHAQACDLDAAGHVLSHALIHRDDQGFLVDAASAELAAYLRRMVFWSDVEIVDTDVQVLSVIGATVDDPAVVLSSPYPGWEGRTELYVPRGELLPVAQRLLQAGVRPAGAAAFDALRVMAFVPEVGRDTDEKTIPHEFPAWIGGREQGGAVHLNKGCYRGQETVARVENLGRSPRALVRVHLDGSAPVDAVEGAVVSKGSRPVGRLGTVAQHCDYGPVGLAVIKRSVLDSAAAREQLHCGEVAVAVDVDTLPPPPAPQAGRLAVDRLRGRA